MKEIFTFDEAKAREVQQELKAKYPENEWSDDYIVGIIKLSCENVDGGYFHGHHGAFDAYLRKFGKAMYLCEECDEMFITDNPNAEFCSKYCENEWFGWH